MSVADGGAVFAYEAQTADGRTFRGTLEARSQEEAKGKLAGLTLRVLRVEPAEENARGRGGRGLGTDDFIIFNQQLAHLTEAGLPVERGLRLIAVDLRCGRLARAAEEVAGELERGLPLQEAFARHAAKFPPLYGQMVEAGAKAGNLPGILFNLGRHLELVGRLRRALWRAISYPVMVLAALSLVMLFVACFVLPKFKDIFKDFRTSLPDLTQFFLNMSDVYPVIFVALWSVVLALALAGVVRWWIGRPGVMGEGALLRMPVVGGVVRANLLSRWIDALRVGVEAGLDLPRAISLAAGATATGRLDREAQQLAEVIGRGEPAAKFQGRMIPATVPAAMELAAKAGDLPAALATLARMYEQQAEQRLRLVPAVLTPLFMIVIGGAIGLCVVAMFLPLVRLVQSVSGG